MKNRRPATTVLAAAVTAFAGLLGAAGPALFSADELPPAHRKWLEDDVPAIITPVERDVFLKLGSDRERDLFIEAFWRRRDPVPATSENEFKAEHFRRLAYADRVFGRTAPGPGRKTDRGRMVVLLGEPDDIVRYYGKAGINDAEVWFYRDKGGPGAPALPPAFHLVFFQEGSVGDFRLYSPSQDGPAALLRDDRGDPANFEAAYRTLAGLDFALASVSLSLVPDESAGPSGRPSAASDVLLQKIETSAADRVDDAYAARFLEFKDIVEVEYSANYLDSRGTMAVLRDPSGLFFVHCALEPVRLTLAAVGREYATTLRLNGMVASADGRPVFQFEKTLDIRMDGVRKDELGRRPFMVQDLFPLIPGTFRVTLLLKNEASREFCSFERTVVVPEPGSGAGLTAPLLGFRARPGGPDPSGLVPFRFGSSQVDFQADRTLTAADDVVLAFQVLGLDAASLPRARFRFEIVRDGTPVKAWERDASAFPDLPDVVESVPAAGLAPAFYSATVRLLVDGREVASAGADFALTPLAAIPRPWIRAKVMPPAGDLSYAGILGRQFAAVGRTAEARALLEGAVAGGAAGPEDVLALARIRFQAGEYPAAAAVLDPFLAGETGPAYEIHVLAASARLGSGDFSGAVEVAGRAMARFGVNPELLNLSAEGYVGLNRLSDARAAWDRSLELNPDQPDIRKKRAGR